MCIDISIVETRVLLGWFIFRQLRYFCSNQIFGKLFDIDLIVVYIDWMFLRVLLRWFFIIYFALVCIFPVSLMTTPFSRLKRTV